MILAHNTLCESSSKKEFSCLGFKKIVENLITAMADYNLCIKLPTTK